MLGTGCLSMNGREVYLCGGTRISVLICLQFANGELRYSTSSIWEISSFVRHELKFKSRISRRLLYRAVPVPGMGSSQCDIKRSSHDRILHTPVRRYTDWSCCGFRVGVACKDFFASSHYLYCTVKSEIISKSDKTDIQNIKRHFKTQLMASTWP